MNKGKDQVWELARETQSGTKVGTYRTDNGQLKTGEIAAWLKTRGTDHQFSAPYTLARSNAYIGRSQERP